MALDVKISYSWTNYCRLCLLDDGILLPLFDSEGMDRQIGHKIESCLQLVTYDGDPLPTKICHKCLYKVDQAYEFRTMALSSFERIKTHLLPLKHVPHVEEYLSKAGCLNKVSGLDVTSNLGTSTRNEGIKLASPKIRVKKEFELMGETQCSSWTSNSPSPMSTSESFPSRVPTTSENSNDTLKRKRFCLPPDSTSVEIPPRNISPVLKKPRMKRALAGPASRKKAAQWKCVFCSSYFSSKATLNSHLEKCLKCAVCFKDFHSFTDKVIHEADHVSVFVACDLAHLKWKCTSCPARFASSVMLSTHSKYSHSPLDRPETICGSASESKVVLNENSVLTTTVSGITKIEGKGRQKNNLNNDVGQSTDAGPQSSESHSCRSCHELFHNERMLLVHEKVIHGLFRCTSCSEVFDSYKALNAHKRCHIVKQTSIKTYFDKSDKSSSPVKKKGLSCNICYEEFEDEDSFVLHLYQHATEQSDDESMPSKKSRKGKDEMKTNTVASVVSSSDGTDNTSEQFSVKCERCHVVCRSKEYYKVHLATHVSKAKTIFSCSACNQDFRNVEALNRHTCGGKQLKKCCLDCGQGLVEGEEHVCDNKCPACNRVFRSSRGQRLHFLHKHEKKVPNESGSPDQLGSNAEALESEEDQIDEERIDEAVQNQNANGCSEAEKQLQVENQPTGECNEKNQNEVHHIMNKEGQNQLTTKQEKETREDSSENSQSDSENCNCIDSDSGRSGSDLGSPSVVRLPPDGASIIEQMACEFDSGTKNIVHEKVSGTLEDNQNAVCIEATL